MPQSGFPVCAACAAHYKAAEWPSVPLGDFDLMVWRAKHIGAQKQ